MQERPHKYEVALSEEQRFVLQQLITKGAAKAKPAGTLHAHLVFFLFLATQP